ncbi:MAG TPA: SDR family oxidoreductase [Bryobacteraceae bacterium]|nr:SDR family oxidoreductase [Bryobacteraceae bacterium]
MQPAHPLALITGASSGIGATFARHLAARGCDLILVARRQDRLEQQAHEITSRHPVQAEILPADLTRSAGLAEVENRIAAVDHLDYLVNNAGFGIVGRFFSVPLEGQDQMHRLHVLAPMRLMHAALPGMVARGRGNIINVSSVSGFGQNPGSVSYSATKTWMTSFTEGIYMELRSAGSAVRVQALCPGFTLSEFHDVMPFDRKKIPAWMWMTADTVVATSLSALDRDQLIVIPGWRYRLLAGLMRSIPRPLYHALSIRYARATGRDRDQAARAG